MVMVLLAATAIAVGQDETPQSSQTAPTSRPDSGLSLPQLEGPEQTGGALKWIALVTVLSLAPAILVMVTSFTRIVVVLGLLRQALATQQLPPNQILFGLALLMTLVVMAPVLKDVHADAVAPYFDGELDGPAALQAAEKHVRGFCIRQISAGGNGEDVRLFLSEERAGREDLTWRDVPTISLLPGFVVSELKIAFLMGFRIFLPFLVVDMLVASVLVSMGMLMLPPVLISLPFKLLLFVLADGWHLVVGTLMTSFG
jgi:flagellar biosynthetic protein FliP